MTLANILILATVWSYWNHEIVGRHLFRRFIFRHQQDSFWQILLFDACFDASLRS